MTIIFRQDTCNRWTRNQFYREGQTVEDLPREYEENLVRHGLAQFKGVQPPANKRLAAPANKAAGNELPDDFPGVKALKEAGINTIDAIPRNRAGLLKIRGIGPFTADEIAEELS